VQNTPIGFKYIAEIMLKEPLLIGGEESGGITIQGYLPERDGILVDLLLCEMVAKRGKSVKDLLKELYEDTANSISGGKNFAVETEKGTRQVKNLALKPPKTLCGYKVVNVDSLDGTKIFLECGGWTLFRHLELNLF